MIATLTEAIEEHIDDHDTDPLWDAGVAGRDLLERIRNAPRETP